MAIMSSNVKEEQHDNIMPPTNKSLIFSERISEADLEDMPNTLLRLTQRLQAPFRRGGSDSGNTQSKDAAPETAAKADKGKGRAVEPDEPVQPVQGVVVPELAHLVHATGIQPLSPKPRRPRKKNPLALTLLPTTPDTHLPNGVLGVGDGNISKGKATKPRDISLGDGIAGPSTQPPTTDPNLWPPTHDSTVDDVVYNTANGGYDAHPHSHKHKQDHQEEEDSDSAYTLLPPSSPSTPQSPTTRLHHAQSTLRTANALIRALHASVDAEREAKEDAQRALDRLHPSHTAHLPAVLEAQASKLAVQAAEIADLKATLDYGNKLLSGSYRRQWEMWRWVDGLVGAEVREEQKKRFGGLGRFAPSKKRGMVGEDGKMPAGWRWESFGKGEDPPVVPVHEDSLSGAEREARMREVLERVRSRELGDMGKVLEMGEGSVAFLPYEEGEFGGPKVPRTELERIESMCAENVKTMKLGVVRMVRLVERIKGRATGILEPEEEVL
ncbi:uncharacterized protein BDZ99DRAFT_500933 [Mytilinidion resinicola]|uniref:Uncharacterized protein n=1 Tax=Mytilinidion resinicola TaxID=574789 RepID=A0A6A6YFS2_9PEZI|nr:uncharacterized protein BDZ99DRAFT_500933 [Mytilinidion resinicola]KAF2806895.1 hypothetical protein BDZ99DRAFT_500933 [Mytilinidion resinicola]